MEEVEDEKSPKSQEEEGAQTAGDTQRTQPTVIEPVDQELPGFNIDDFLGDIIGYPSEYTKMEFLFIVQVFTAEGHFVVLLFQINLSNLFLLSVQLRTGSLLSSGMG